LIFVWIYIQRVNLDYNSEGRYFSLEEGVVYHKEAEAVYGFLAILGIVLTGLFLTRIILKIKSQRNTTE